MSHARARACWRPTWTLIGLSLAACAGASLATASAQETARPGLNLVFTGPSQPVAAGSAVQLSLNVLNISKQVTDWTFPANIRCEIQAGQLTLGTSLQVVAGPEPNPVRIPPGGFAHRDYSLKLPAEALGQVVIAFTGLDANRLVLEVQPPAVSESETPAKSGLAKALEQAVPKPFDPVRFFMAQFSPYQPFYFVAGLESPNAKFQLSLKYQLLNNEGPLAEKYPLLKGFNFAYTQTSLWDWNKPSAPFLDSSYKPELLYLWKHAAGGGPTNRFTLDLQPGFQHESNGKGGADSRSINIAYFRPTFTFGREEGLQLTLQPQAWIYVGSLSDNPDIARYRGYANLRAILGWQRGLQLSAIGYLGDRADRASLQLDLTYPMVRIWSNFNVYLDLQYFIGYGESLLLYNERSSAFRVGFALYR